MKHKTFRVSALVKLVNDQNRLSTCDPLIREGWNTLLEEVLHDANDYQGYGYLAAKDVPLGQMPGIMGEPGNFTVVDESRRHYIHHS